MVVIAAKRGEHQGQDLSLWLEVNVAFFHSDMDICISFSSRQIILIRSEINVMFY